MNKYVKSFKSHSITWNTTVVLVFLMLVTMAADCGGGGGGNGGGGSSESTSSKACVSITVDTIKHRGTLVDVKGTVTNNCSKAIWMAEVQATCFSSSGSVVDRDPEYVEDVSSGGQAYYSALIQDDNEEVEKCKSEVTDVTFK